MCGPQYSSTWANELKLSKDNWRIQGKTTHTKNNLVDNLDLSNLRELHFNGGEPLINNEHCKLLETIDNISECVLSYNTNGTFLPSRRTTEIWAKAKLVKLYFSIDAIENAFEYIRYRANWKDTEHNIKWLIENASPNVMFGLNVTVGTYNVLEMADLYEWFNKTLKTNRFGDESSFMWQQAMRYDPCFINDDAKQEATELLGDIPVFNSLLSMLSNGSTNNNWINYLTNIDERRGIDWKSALRIGKYYK